MIQIFKDRYSCRNYSTRPVEKAKIINVLEGARLAPSACNKQPWIFYVVTNPLKRQEILAKSRPAFLDAPVLIVAVGHHSEAWHRPADDKDHTDVDVAIAVEHICLQATAEGLATCWVCSFDTEATKKALALTDDLEPIALIPLGYSADTAISDKRRKALDDISVWVD